MMIAEINPPAGFAAWIACAAFLVMLFNQSGKAWDRMRGEKPNPPNPQLGQSLVEIDRRVNVLEAWKETITEKLQQDKEDILAAGEERASRIHQHIEADRKTLDEKIDGMPERVITILKNAGAIGKR